MSYFASLRTNKWKPGFAWIVPVEVVAIRLNDKPIEGTVVDAVNIASDRINQPHEDYPKRVRATKNTILWATRFLQQKSARMEFSRTKCSEGWCAGISGALFKDIHYRIFRDQPFAGQWRSVAVRVGNHLPPPPETIHELMNRLEQLYPHIHYISTLRSWYTDFQTIHPFQDGNGRVGGVVVSAVSHILDSDRGWMIPTQ